jgi:O-antigen/teichoic acid export membrane protein
VTEVGLGAVALREYSAREGADRDRFMREILGARVVLTAVGVLAATGFAVLAGYGTDLVFGTVLAGIGLVIAVVGGTFSVALAAELRLGWLTAIDLGGKVLGVALIVVLVVANAGVLAFLAVTVPAGLVAITATVTLVRGRVPLRPSFRVAEMLRLAKDTLSLAVATVLFTFYARIVIILMSLISTPLATGYFGTAYRVVEVAVGIPSALVGTTFPVFARAARDDHDRLRYVLQRVAEVALIGGVWLALSTALGADLIASVLVGASERAPVADVLVLLSLALVPIFLNLTWQTTLLALRCHRELLVANGIGLLVIVAMTLALVPPFGAPGAAVVVVAAEACLMSLSALLLLRAHPDLRPYPRVIPRVLVAAATALAVPLLLALPDVLAVPMATVVYFGILAALRAIPSELWSAFTERGLPSAPPGTHEASRSDSGSVDAR